MPDQQTRTLGQEYDDGSIDQIACGRESLDPWRNGGNNGGAVTVLEGESVLLLIEGFRW